MFLEKTQSLIDNLGALDIPIAVIDTMGGGYKNTHNNCSIMKLRDPDIVNMVGTIARTRKFKGIVIDNLFHLYPSYERLHMALQGLSEIAKEYKVFIYT